MPGVLHPTPLTSFVQFGIELVGPLTKSTCGNKYTVVLTDYLTKWHESITNKEASMIAKFLVKVICSTAAPGSSAQGN